MSRWGRLITVAARPAVFACLLTGAAIPAATAMPLNPATSAVSAGHVAVGRATSVVDASAPFDTQLLALVNRFRIAHRRPPLTALADLADRATAWSTHLRDVGSLSHDANLSAQAAAICSVREVRENVAFADMATPAQLLAAYIASPLHRANLLATDVRFVGIGTVSQVSPVVAPALRYWNTMKFVGGRCPSTAQTATRYLKTAVSISMPRVVPKRQMVNLAIRVRTTSLLPWVAVYFTSKRTGATSLVALSPAGLATPDGYAHLNVSVAATRSGTYIAVYGGGRIGARTADLGSVGRHVIVVKG